MRQIFKTLLLVLIFGVAISEQSIAQTTSNTTDPDWDSGGDWTGSSPGYDTNRSAILAHDSDISGNPLIINDGHTVTINAGVILTTDETITVKEGGAFIVNGTVTGTGSGKEIKIEKGTFIVNSGGAFNWNGGGVWTSDDNPVTITINGTVNVSGDMSNKVTITGSGSIEVGGTLNNDGGTIFGCSDPGAACCTGGGCTLGTVLPVELLNFSAAYEESVVNLEWSTATELNNDYFNIERSQEELNWNTIATIAGAGDSDVILTYEYSDKNPPLGLVYYRLKQTDYDGTFEYHGTISIYSDTEGLKQVYPNPTNGNFRISMLDGDKAEFLLRNTLGQFTAVPRSVGINHVEFDASKLTKGIYFLTVKIGSESTTSKILLE